ncbi:kinase domain protein [Ostertagia ostertagi]
MTTQLPSEENMSMEMFALLRVLGRGAYGKVFLVRKIGGKDHGQIYAMKVLRKIRTISLEYVRGGELFTHLCSRGSFDVTAAKFIIAELIVAIDNLHQRKVIYRDLKLENILLDEHGHVKLTDFGLSKLLVPEELERANSYCGTIEYIHRFLRDLDWDTKSPKRQLTPFIVPNLTHELDVQNFATEFTNQPPLYSPAESPVNGNTLFRGYSYISPSVIFANNNIIGEELMQEDIQVSVLLLLKLLVFTFIHWYRHCLLTHRFSGNTSWTQQKKDFWVEDPFSVVRRCERIEDGALFAVKIVSQRFATQAQREARILDIVKGHINIVRLIDVHSDPLHYYIVMELLTGQELLKRLRKLEKFTEAEAADIMRQLVSAVGFLHAKRIVHRDLKPENILFESEDSSARLRLVDFGFARLLPACVEQQLKSVYRKMTPCFTLQYAAPEVLDLGDTLPEYNEQCDLWSLGVILFTMLSGQVPFHARSKTESATDIMQRIRKAEFSFESDAWRAVSTEAKQLINGLLTVDPKKRLSMQELSRHAWLNSSSSLETPLQTPNVLPSFAGETFNETLQAFLTANRDGFHLMDVEAAPLMKRRGLKRQSAEKEANDKASKRKAAFETVPEENPAPTPPANRPNSLGMIPSDSMMNYRVPAAGTIRETRGSDSS